MLPRNVRIGRILAVATLAVPLCGIESDPGRGVARISVVTGNVSVRRGDSGEWVAAAPNAPLVTGDHVATGVSSKSEVQFDWANMIRLAPETEIRLKELSHNRYLIQVARGTVTLRVLRDSDAEADVSTPLVSVRPVKKGSYRITVMDEGRVEVTVRSGEAEVYSPAGVESLKSGKTMLVRGTAAAPEFQLAKAIPDDAWDEWNESRDNVLKASGSYRYVSRDIYGAEDLEGHGRWVYVPPYGWVWQPYVDPAWAPYRYGRWSWVDWYGWSWISYDPWGWAPYHYGRWFYGRPYGWCWYPGGYYAHHYWAPGLVAFFGFGGWYGGFGFSVGFGFGNVGWVPLAPYEPYYHWHGHHYRWHDYHHGGGYGHYGKYVDNSVNVVNNINIANNYRNARIGNAITAVNAADFSAGRTGNLVQVGRRELESAGLVRGALPVSPARESLRWSDRESSAAFRDRASGRETFFARREAARVERLPFEVQQRAMQEMAASAFGTAGGVNPGARTEVGRGRAVERTAGASTSNPVATSQVRATAGAGRDSATRQEGSVAREAGQGSRAWRTVSPERTDSVDAVQNRSAPVSQAVVSEEDRGWRRFGEPLRRESQSSQQGTGATSREGAARQGWVDRSTGSDRSAPERGAAQETGWQRFGEPRQRQEGADLGRSGQTEAGASTLPPSRDRGAVRNESETESWRRFQDRPSSRGGAQSSGEPGGVDRGAFGRGEPAERWSPRSESPAYEGSRPNVGREGWFGRGSQRGERLEINPPIIRERSAPRSESTRPDFGGGRESRPSMSMPDFGGSRGRDFGGPRIESRGGGGGVRPSAPSGSGETRQSAPRGDAGGGRGGRGR